MMKISGFLITKIYWLQSIVYTSIAYYTENKQ